MAMTQAPRSADAEDAAAAKAHYKKATVLFDLQKYAEAIDEFEAAYTAKADPVFLFNVAQAARLSGKSERALGAYRSYLRRLPEARNRVEVESFIAELEAQIAEHERAAAATGEAQLAEHPIERAAPAVPAIPSAVSAPAAPSAADQHRQRNLKIAGIATASAGVALLGAGAALVGVAYASFNELNNPPAGYVFSGDVETRMKIFEPLGGVLLGVGAAAAGAGIALAILGARGERSATSRRVTFLPAVRDDHVGFSLTGAF